MSSQFLDELRRSRTAEFARKNADELSKRAMFIVMIPPADGAPLQSLLKLSSGSVYFSDLARGGRIRVLNSTDALELERAGWTRET